MSDSLYEIVILANGEVLLQRRGEDEEPLVRIIFSDGAKYHLQDDSLEVAQAMIDAGIHILEQLDSEDRESSEIRFNSDFRPRTLH